MHIFDIRRSNSVTGLWKLYELPADDDSIKYESRADAVNVRESAVGPEVASDNTARPTSSTAEASRPLLAAFEAELAQLLASTETSDSQARQSEPSPAARPSVNSDSRRAPPAIEALVAQVVYYLRSGVNVMQSELRTRMPELRRQLREVQGEIPENLRVSLQAFIAQLEAQMRSAYSNLPEHGRQLAEEAVQAGRPMAENAAESLWTLVSDFEQAGRSLFAAFENEFGQDGSNATGATAQEPSHASSEESIRTNINHQAPQFNGSCPVNESPQTEGREVPRPSSTQEHHRFTIEPIAMSSNPMNGSHNVQVGHGHSPRVLNPFGVPTHVGVPDHSSHSHPIPLGPPSPWPLFGAPAAQWFARPNLAKRSACGSSGNASPTRIAKDPSGLDVVGAHTQTPERETNILFIGNVGFAVTERMISNVFHARGFVLEVYLPPSTLTGTHVGFGYLHFPSADLATAALIAMQGVHIDGHAINLEYCQKGDAGRTAPQRSTKNANLNTFKSQPSSCSESDGRGSREQTASDEGAALQKPGSPLKRRKPVTFGDRTPQQTDLDTQPDVSGFPPVSQLEAHQVASQSSNAPRRTGTDAWARLDRRERRRSRQSLSRDAHGASDTKRAAVVAPISKTRTNKELAQESAIEKCITSLANMGFGAPEQGGRSRLAVYAAAANGNIYDAIGLIEEEQKAYAARGQE